MEFARRAAAPADADADYSPLDPSPHGQMTMDALRRELLKESIRQEVISAELAGRRKLEANVRRRELGLYCDRTTHAGPSMSRRSVKDRIEEWYRPPWHDRTADEDDASFNWAMVHKKVFSGVKRKRTAKTAETNNKKLFEEWSCALCQLNTTSELFFEEHCAGHQHQSNIAALESRKETTGFKRKAAAESLSVMQHNPTTWNFSICQAKCSSESDFKNHLRGRKHQENFEALRRECYNMKENSGFQEASLYAKHTPRRAKNKNLNPLWICSICQAEYTYESDLQNHLRGRRHQENMEALHREDEETDAKFYEKKAPQLAEKNKKPVARWNCSICKVNCRYGSELENHLRGRRHRQNVEAQCLEGRRQEYKSGNGQCII